MNYNDERRNRRHDDERRNYRPADDDRRYRQGGRYGSHRQEEHYDTRSQNQDWGEGWRDKHDQREQRFNRDLDEFHPDEYRNYGNPRGEQRIPYQRRTDQDYDYGNPRFSDRERRGSTGRSSDEYERMDYGNYPVYGSSGRSFGRMRDYSQRDYGGFDSFGDDWTRDRERYGHNFGNRGGYQSLGGGQYMGSGYSGGGYSSMGQNPMYDDRRHRSHWDDQDRFGRDSYGSRYGDYDQWESHRGKGPKNYKRSDSRITEDVNDALHDHHHIDASNIEVEVKDGNVILSGEVNSRREKRGAESAIDYISGVQNVENRLHVKSQSSRMSSSDESNNQETSRQESSSSAKNKNASSKSLA